MFRLRAQGAGGLDAATPIARQYCAPARLRRRAHVICRTQCSAGTCLAMTHVGPPATVHAEHPTTWEDKQWNRSEEHTSELQSLMRISYAVFCLKKKTKKTTTKKSLYY